MSSVAIVNEFDLDDARRDMATGTPRAVRGRLVACLDTVSPTNTSALFGIHRWGWGFSMSQDFNGDIARRVLRPPGPPPCCDAGTPIRSAFCAHGASCLRSWGARHPATRSSTGTGVVTFLMG